MHNIQARQMVETTSQQIKVPKRRFHPMVRGLSLEDRVCREGRREYLGCFFFWSSERDSVVDWEFNSMRHIWDRTEKKRKAETQHQTPCAEQASNRGINMWCYGIVLSFGHCSLACKSILMKSLSCQWGTHNNQFQFEIISVCHRYQQHCEWLFKLYKSFFPFFSPQSKIRK